MISDANSYAAIYARRSILSDNGSLDVQTKSCTTYAAKNKLIVYKVYAEATSAVKNDVEHRNGLFNMLEDARNGLFKSLIVSKRDRLARKFEDYLTIKKQLHKLGVNIYFADEATYVSNDDPMANFIDNMLMAVADLEPHRIKDKTLAGMIEKKKAGEYNCGTPPLGYIKSKDKILINNRTCHSFSPDGKVIETIKTIYSTYVDNPNLLTPNDLHKFLISKGLISTDIDTQKVSNILFNPVYAGLMTISKDIVYKSGKLLNKPEDLDLAFDGIYFKRCSNIPESIVSPEIWFKAINKLNTIPPSKPRFQNKANDIFKNLIYCKHCNNRISLSNNYYRCECKRTSISKGNVRKSIINYLLTSDISKESILTYINKVIPLLNKEKSSLYSRYTKCLIKRKNIIDSYIVYQDENLQNEILKLTREKENLAQNLSNINHQIKALNINSKKLDTLLMKLEINLVNDDDLLKLILNALIEKVYINGSTMEYEFNVTKERSHCNLFESLN